MTSRIKMRKRVSPGERSLRTADVFPEKRPPEIRLVSGRVDWKPEKVIGWSLVSCASYATD